MTAQRMLLAGIRALAMRLLHVHQQGWIFGLSMTIVIAMAFQNAFGRLYAKDIYGPTTVMTGKSFVPATGRNSLAGLRLPRLPPISPG